MWLDPETGLELLPLGLRCVEAHDDPVARLIPAHRPTEAMPVRALPVEALGL
jgi:hypothetical protein